jgi:hypothetical protein
MDEQWIPKVATLMRFHNALAETILELKPIDSWPHTTEVQQQLF